MFICQLFVYWYSRHLFLIHWGDPSVQSMFVCHVLCSWYSRHLCSINLGAPSGKSMFICQVWFGVAGIQGISSSINLGGPSSKVGLSAKCGVAVFEASILYFTWVVHHAKVGSSAKFLCTGIQGTYALLIRGSISQSMFHLPSLV